MGKCSYEEQVFLHKWFTLSLLATYLDPRGRAFKSVHRQPYQQCPKYIVKQKNATGAPKILALVPECYQFSQD